MELYKLIDGIDCELDARLLSTEVSGVTADSRKVKEGDVFICLEGVNQDGNRFIADALKAGAKAIVSTLDLSLECAIKVDDARQAYSLISKNLYNKACDRLKIIAVTGTNGKTTTVNLIAEILKSCGKNVATIGTMGVVFNGNEYDTGFTTPDPDMLHKYFQDMLHDDIEYVVMEASAHAIALKKLAGIKFEIGVLTNITQDHLDYFGDMENYAKAKMSFFNDKNMKLALVCADDTRARTLLSSASVTTLSYGLDNPSDVFAINIENGFDKTKFICNVLDDIVPIKTNLVGRYNVENALASIGVCRMLGVPSSQIARSIRYINPVEGRFNVIKHPKCNIVIDYAHTPDGLENVLKTARELTNGQLIALFGCGGNRDKMKRPIMAQVASRYADKVIITSDNPRFEEPNEIISEIEQGMMKTVPYQTIENREEAIAVGLEQCQKGDTLVIAGKGGEKYQDIKGEKRPYNDFDAVYKYFREHIKIQKDENDYD